MCFSFIFILGAAALSTTAGDDEWQRSLHLLRLGVANRHHDAVWTSRVALQAWQSAQQYGAVNNCISKQEPTRYTAEAHNFKLEQDDVTGILNSWKEWGTGTGTGTGTGAGAELGVTADVKDGNAKGYWTATPGYGSSGSTQNPGLGGAEIFHKSGCSYDPKRLSDGEVSTLHTLHTLHTLLIPPSLSRRWSGCSSTAVC